MVTRISKKDTTFRGLHLQDAGLFGVTEAFIIQQIIHWCKLTKRKPEEGIYKTSDEWEHELVFLAKRTSIRLAIKNLKEQGIICLKQGPGRHNHQLWYSLNMDLLEKLRSNFKMPVLKKKEEIEMKPCTFNASIKGTNLLRMSNDVIQNLNYIEGDETLEDLHLVVQNTAFVGQNPNYIADLYLYIITKTLQISYLQNKNSCELDFDQMFAFYNKVTQGFRRTGKKAARDQWSSWPQWQRDVFFGRMADNLLEQYLINDYLYWGERDINNMFIGGLGKTSRTPNSFVNKWLEREPPNDEEYYDGLRKAKIKNIGKNKQSKQSSTNQAQRTKQRYLALVQANGGRDPIVDGLTTKQG
jgi:hypothetical protein